MNGRSDGPSVGQWRQLTVPHAAHCAVAVSRMRVLRCPLGDSRRTWNTRSATARYLCHVVYQSVGCYVSWGDKIFNGFDPRTVLLECLLASIIFVVRLNVSPFESHYLTGSVVVFPIIVVNDLFTLFSFCTNINYHLLQIRKLLLKLMFIKTMRL